VTVVAHHLKIADVGAVDLTMTESGEGPAFLLLHGGAGPQSMTGFAESLASARGVRTIAPTHPGFGGTARPSGLASIAGLARLYAALLDELDLRDVTLVGNSVGGWIAAELALIHSPRIGRLVLLDAVGLEVQEHPIADFFSLSMDAVFKLSFHDPAAFRIDPSTLPPAAQAVAVGNRAALDVYAGTAMSDPTLRDRLGAVDVPALVLWGDSDGIVDPRYGQAYAAAIPQAQFHVLPKCGHLPQLEAPELVIAAMQGFS